MKSGPTVLSLAADLAAGRITSRALVEQALAAIVDPAGEGARVFLEVDAEGARRAADAQDQLRQAGYVLSPLAGLPVSIKDLFDVRGQRTRGGSAVLKDQPAATRDAAIVHRLRQAGAVLIGRTNMTEFAFSGVGINPHYGTPGNPFDRARIPGGSSSGAGVSVADGMAVVAIGTDTGGSVRIPAALCGLSGFKPTARRIPQEGMLPLSTTLDSIGPLARSISCCIITDAIMAGEAPRVPDALPLAGLRFLVPTNYVVDGLDPEVAAAFERACTELAEGGAWLVEQKVPEFDQLTVANQKGGFPAPEAYAWHADLLARRGGEYDPRVSVRIERGREMSAADYVRLVEDRRRIVASFNASLAPFDALLMPTVAKLAPPLSAFAPDADYARLNAMILRNPSVVNFLDGCAATVPIQRGSELAVGLSVVGTQGSDARILRIALGVEALQQAD
ncbi:MAG: amidase [Xanthobacteraceae bacterium]|nr:amidase [Xanthobacteraceae bacterium]MBV9629236.1 amidase [Xanthobacteraceae bacterium]